MYGCKTVEITPAGPLDIRPLRILRHVPGYKTVENTPACPPVPFYCLGLVPPLRFATLKGYTGVLGSLVNLLSLVPSLVT